MTQVLLLASIAAIVPNDTACFFPMPPNVQARALATSQCNPGGLATRILLCQSSALRSAQEREEEHGHGRIEASHVYLPLNLAPASGGKRKKANRASKLHLHTLSRCRAPPPSISLFEPFRSIIEYHSTRVQAFISIFAAPIPFRQRAAA
ncbi:hypothetical protein MPH_00406 [Macrophomina phaseolina MS6]|uniref:Secreted protein n=1 Tax=Macrophomina phaseolina (strain MS6) TaxID=1126212 RepID=K2SBB0_MACPH|nr:hypothetical protein MPH_00406 [Macrophomina phaseolina MS6]